MIIRLDTPPERSHVLHLCGPYKKLRHIVLLFQIQIVAKMDPLKYLFEKHALSGSLTRWLFLLAEFGLKYVVRKMIKWVSGFCAENPIKGDDGKEDFPNQDIWDIELSAWKMYFDRAVNQYGNGIVVLLITPNGVPLAVKLNFEVTNNMARYEACIT